MKNKILALVTVIRLIIKKIKYGSKLQFGLPILISMKAKFRIDKGNSKIVLGKMVDIKENCRLDAVGGEIHLGKNVFLNRNTVIVSMQEVEIGDYTKIGPNLIIYDHDHDYCGDRTKYLSAPVKIGKNVWIGANCTILKGVKIGNNSVIAAGTVVTSDIKSDVVVYQKRETRYKSIYHKVI